MFVPGAAVTDDEAEEIQNKKRNGADESFHRECEKIKGEHVEQQVPNVSMDKAAQYHRAVLFAAVKMIGPEQAHIDDARRPEQSHQADTDGQYHDKWCRYAAVLEHLLVSLRLQIEKMSVLSVFCEKTFMRSAFENPALMNYDDLRGRPYRRESM